MYLCCMVLRNISYLTTAEIMDLFLDFQDSDFWKYAYVFKNMEYLYEKNVNFFNAWNKE